MRKLVWRAQLSMSTFRSSDLLWLTVKLNPFEEHSNHQKTLVDFSAEKLISDVYLLHQTDLNIPKKIFSILLAKAVDKGRILSVVELVKRSPFEKIEFSTPNALRDLSAIEAKDNFTKRDDLKGFYDVALSIFNAFLEVISKRRCNSQLKTLSLDFVPVNKKMLKLLIDFVEKNQEKSKKRCRNLKNVLKYNPKEVKRLHELYKLCLNDLQQCQKPPDLQGQYVLKCALLLEESEEILDVLRWYLLAKEIGFDLIITGVFYYNVMCPTFLVSEITKIVNPCDFQLLSLIFSDFSPSSKLVFSELKNFRYLKYLNISYMRNTFKDESVLEEFSKSLTMLLNLKRLVLRSIKLTNCLSYMFNEFCKRKSDSSILTQCCLGHCGSLEYLDVSGCCLSGEDIVFFKDLSAFNCLKYLDISDNSLSVTSTLQTLLYLSSSLLVLNMANCFGEAVEYNAEIFPLRVFTQIRILNIKGMKINPTNKEMLHSEIKKMTFDCLRTDDEPPFDSLTYEQFLTLHSYQL